MTGFIDGATRRRLIVALAALSIIGAHTASAQQPPTGAYRSPNASLRLTADGNATVSDVNGPLSITSYHITGDTLSFRDERASAACSEEPGLYLWRIAADTLRLQVLTDRCEGRRAALATEWTRLIGALTAVVITAERQAQDLQRSALAVSVVSGEETRDANVTRPQDLTNLVPGLMIGAINGGSALTYLRGVGNAAATSLQDPAVTFNFDGVYIAHPTSTGGLYYDLERVEVLKGPQGTLYGRNATGGAINILPRHPQLREQDGELSAEYGNHNGRQLTGWYNMPLGDRAAVRVAGQGVAHDSYMKDGTDDQDDRAGRVAFRFDPTDALRFHLGADYHEQRGHGPGSTPLAIGTETRDGITSPAGGAYLETQTVTITHRDFLPLPSQQRANNRHRGVNATLDWNTALGALTVIPAARASDLDEHSTQTTLEAHLASNPTSRVHLLTGGFFFRENVDLHTRPYNEFNFSMQHPSFSTTSVAPFGRVTFDVTNKLRATLGARYTHEDKRFGGTFQAFSRICPTASCPNAQPFPVDIATAPITFPADSTNATPVPTGDGTLTVGSRVTSKDSATYSRTTWRAEAEYDLSNQALLYSSYETGFKRILFLGRCGSLPTREHRGFHDRVEEPPLVVPAQCERRAVRLALQESTGQQNRGRLEEREHPSNRQRRARGVARRRSRRRVSPLRQHTRLGERAVSRRGREVVRVLGRSGPHRMPEDTHHGWRLYRGLLRKAVSVRAAMDGWSRSKPRARTGRWRETPHRRPRALPIENADGDRLPGAAGAKRVLGGRRLARAQHGRRSILDRRIRSEPHGPNHPLEHMGDALQQLRGWRFATAADDWPTRRHALLEFSVRQVITPFPLNSQTPDQPRPLPR
jgi:hypothetical protein